MDKVPGYSEESTDHAMMDQPRVTLEPGYAHVTCNTMVSGVATLQQPLPLKQISFAVAGSVRKMDSVRKVS
jgi:hypothetical protein